MLLSQSKAKQTRADSFLPLNSYSNKKQSQHCDQCGLLFDTLPQLLNHRRRFCQNSGYDNLTGLLMKQTGRNQLKVDYKLKKGESLKKNNDTKMKSYGQYSLSKIKYDPNEDQVINKRSLLLYDDMMELQKHKNGLQSVRPYQIKPKFSESNAHKMQENSKFFSQKKPSMDYANSKSGSSFSYRLNDQNFSNKQPSNADYLHDLLLKNQQSVSPATKSLVKQRKPIAKQFLQDSQAENIVHCKTNLASVEFSSQIKKPTLLNKSDASIANMPVDQKITYAKYKLDELESIRELYLKNGGQSKEFKANVEKMIVFYEKLLKDCQSTNLNESRLSLLSRPQTPIMKLNDLSNNLEKKGGSNGKIVNNSARPEYNNGVKQANYGTNQTYPKNQHSLPHQHPILPSLGPLGYPSHMADPNAMMAQNYAHMYHTKVMEDALRSKSQQNRKLIEALIESIKKDKNHSNPKEQPSNQDSLQEKYRFSNEVIASNNSQERILKLLQEQELDELTLLSKLPVPLQDQKLQSIKKNSQLRFKMEKEVLKQKLQRLAWQQQIQSQQEKRQVHNNQWIGANNKHVIKTQMHQYLQDFKDQFGYPNH